MRKNERKYGKRKKVEQMPLTMATMGEVNKIVKVGGNEETRRFLENLGFVAGTEITVVSSIGGNLIVNVKDSRIAVNEDMARHIVI
jgi:ferrous iron transport protein A